MKTRTKQVIMYDRIRDHGENLQAIFGLEDVEAVVLSKKLLRLESRMGLLYEGYCNGTIEYHEVEEREAEVRKSLIKLLGRDNVEKLIVFNRDPRGHALKIRSEFASDMRIHRDMGGYGILAPTFNGE